jgi:hypothetical protein
MLLRVVSHYAQGCIIFTGFKLWHNKYFDKRKILFEYLNKWKVILSRFGWICFLCFEYGVSLLLNYHSQFWLVLRVPRSLLHILFFSASGFEWAASLRFFHHLLCQILLQELGSPIVEKMPTWDSKVTYLLFLSFFHLF